MGRGTVLVSDLWAFARPRLGTVPNGWGDGYGNGSGGNMAVKAYHGDGLGYGNGRGDGSGDGVVYSADVDVLPG